ncbi:hypothetical protein Tco_0092221 [Tanacetum coccineum]
MTTLAEFMIISGANNRPLMLEKSLYDSWKSQDGTTRTKKYEELSIAEKLQADCDLKATNIVLQGLLLDVYAIMNRHKVAKEIWDRVKVLMQGTKLSLQEKESIAYNTPQSLTQPLTEFHQMDSGLAIPVFNQGDDPIACLNKAMAFLTVVASSRFPSTNNQLRTSSNLRNQATIQDGRVTVGNNTGGPERVVKCYNYQGECHIARQCTQPKRPRNATWFKEKEMLAEAQEAGQTLDEEQLAFLADPGIPDDKAVQTTIPNTASFQTKDLDAYDSNCDDVSNEKAVLMANLSNNGSDVISKVPHHEPYHTDMDNQSVHTMQVISSQHVASPVIDDEETLILEKNKNCLMNKPSVTNFTPPKYDQSASSPVKIEAPKELSK